MVPIVEKFCGLFWKDKPPYPGFKKSFVKGVEVWNGTLGFDSRYDSIRIRDSYKIRIEFLGASHLPFVYETGGRVDEIASKRKISDKRDLHVNSTNGSICLCPRPEVKRRFPQTINAEVFIRELVIPYFFALSYFEKHGKWPWGFYGHGDIGIYEYYFDKISSNDLNLLEDCVASLQSPKSIQAQMNGNEGCLCGSKVKFKKCHRRAFNGRKAMVDAFANKDENRRHIKG